VVVIVKCALHLHVHGQQVPCLVAVRMTGGHLMGDQDARPGVNC
jgi:hypothetical protein